MEFKRACCLPFTTIAKLLELLQLVCPANNHLPTSLHKFKKFFGQYSSECTAHYHCHVCHTEYLPGQTECTNFANAKQDTLIVINPKKAITRVLKSKCYKLNALLMFIFSALFVQKIVKILYYKPRIKGHYFGRYT